MSDQPGEGYVYRYSQLLKKLTSAKGGEPLLELSRELVPVLVVESDRHEYRHIAGENTGWGGVEQAASVGNFNEAQLFNPSGSGTIVTIEQLLMGSVGGAAFQLRDFDSALAGTTGIFKGQRDRRSQPVSAQIRQAVPAAQDGTLRLQLPAVGANVLVVLLVNHTLSPGTGLIISTNANNSELSASFIWRERAAEPSELGQ